MATRQRPLGLDHPTVVPRRPASGGDNGDEPAETASLWSRLTQ